MPIYQHIISNSKFKRQARQLVYHNISARMADLVLRLQGKSPKMLKALKKMDQDHIRLFSYVLEI